MSAEPSPGFARAAVARSLGDFLARYPGVDVEHLLRHAGITPQVLADPNSALSFALWCEMGELAAAATGDSAIGARFAAQMPWKDLGIFAHVIFNSPTLGAALGNSCRYLGLQQNVARATLEIGDDSARVLYHLDHPSIPHHVQQSEGIIMMFARICRDGLQATAWAPREVQFRHPRPASIAVQETLFGCPIAYGQPVDALVLARADLREPLRDADPELLPVLLQHADKRLATTSFDEGFVGRVTRLVTTSLSSGEVTIEHVSTELGSSPRTIQRRLRAHGLAFKDVVARARLSLSKLYLGDPSLTLTEAAFLLGYSDLSAFSRAFRRWTGRSALAFRRDQLGKT